MWDSWSSTSDKYPGKAELLKKWSGFKPASSFMLGKGVGFGTIFDLAEQNGFVMNPPRIFNAQAENSGVGSLTTKQAIDACFSDVVGVGSLAEWDIAGAVAYGVRDLFRWVDEQKSWVYLDCSTHVWHKDFRGLIRTAVAAYIACVELNVLRDIQHGGNDADNRKILGKISKLKSRQSIDAVIELAKSMPGMTVSVTEFDVDVNVVAFTNGLLYDLSKCEARPIKAGDLISRTLAVPYIQEASCPTWIRCWGDWFPGNPEVVGMMKRFLGYMLSGNVNEQVLAYLYGPGQNGKGVVTGTINLLWGDLCCVLPQEALMVKKMGGGGPDSTFASVEGCLAAVVAELEDGAVFHEAHLKWITGSDALLIEQKYEKARKIIPKFKLLICGNVLPIVRGQDKGIWRRFLLIPFATIIPDDQKDPKLMDKLTSELPGIAQWCIEGWKDYKKIGLAVPLAVKAATEEYKNEMDVIGHFLTEETKIDERFEIDSSTLYAQYSDWAKRNGHYVFNSAAFGRKLSGRGIRSKKVTGGKRKYIGLTLA
jgi:putative DNA primase/helicase